MNNGKMMSMMMTAAVAGAGLGAGAQADAQVKKGRILVIVSSENQMPLQKGKTYSTGYYLNELTVPVKAVMDQGYEVVFANPKGNPPSMDIHSDTADLFGGDVARLESYRRFRDSLTGLRNPVKISDVIWGGLERFDGVFFPGGHAPMVDLLQDPEVGAVLRYFHEKALPTALLCHGPISLLAALPDAGTAVAALRGGEAERARGLPRNWIYTGYKMTVFSTAEEKQAERGQIGGTVLFYPESALRLAGGKVRVAEPWSSHAIRDRELITGQNPFSDEALAKLFIEALKEKRK